MKIRIYQCFAVITLLVFPITLRATVTLISESRSQTITTNKIPITGGAPVFETVTNSSSGLFGSYFATQSVTGGNTSQNSNIGTSLITASGNAVADLLFINPPGFSQYSVTAVSQLGVSFSVAAPTPFSLSMTQTTLFGGENSISLIGPGWNFVSSVVQNNQSKPNFVSGILGPGIYQLSAYAEGSAYRSQGFGTDNVVNFQFTFAAGVPDGGNSLVLLAVGLGAAFFLRRHVRKAS